MRGVFVKGYIEERAMEIARYIIDNNATVRQAQKSMELVSRRYMWTQ